MPAIQTYTHIAVMVFATIVTGIYKIYLNDSGTTAMEQFTKWSGDKFLNEKGMEKDVYSLDSGLKFKILNKGAGEMIPGLDTDCTIHYEASFINGTVFDSSYERKMPLTLSPPQGNAGWMQALQLMREGDKWEIYVPERLAYGAKGLGKIVLPYSTLVYKLELLKLSDEAAKNSGGRPSLMRSAAEADEQFVGAFGRAYELL